MLTEAVRTWNWTQNVAFIPCAAKRRLVANGHDSSLTICGPTRYYLPTVPALFLPMLASVALRHPRVCFSFPSLVWLLMVLGLTVVTLPRSHYLISPICYALPTTIKAQHNKQNKFNSSVCSSRSTIVRAYFFLARMF